MRVLWTRLELIEVLKLYCELPFGKIHSRNPLILELAGKINRTPSAVALKMSNFASLDPTLNQKGMANASSLDKVVWEEFFADMERFLSPMTAEPEPSGFEESPLVNFEWDLIVETERTSIVVSRLSQGFFRRMILASYRSTCAITGINDEKLLIAGHIVPWSVRQDLRMNPHNGICLNALHDKAFDSGLITIGEKFEIIFSSIMKKETRFALEQFGESKFNFPEKFAPDAAFLAYHRESVFRL